MTEGGQPADFDSDKAELFEALSHPTRIRILKSLEEGSVSYADLKREVGIESNGHMAFHLGKLEGLVTTTAMGTYALTPEGKEALNFVETVGPTSNDGRGGLFMKSRLARQWKTVVAVLLAALLVLAATTVYFCQSSNTNYNDYQATIEKVNSLNAYVGVLNQSYLSAINEYQAANENISSLNAEVVSLNSTVATLTDEVTSLKAAGRNECVSAQNALVLILSDLQNMSLTFQSQIQSDQAMISSLNTTKPSGYGEMITTLQNQISQDNSLLNLIASQVTVVSGPSTGVTPCSLFYSP